MSQKLDGWKTRTLSAVDKVILIKSSLIGVSQYLMNWFKFSKFIAKDIDKVNKDFFGIIIVIIRILIIINLLLWLGIKFVSLNVLSIRRTERWERSLYC